MNTSDGPIRVVLAGDCPLLRSGFRQVLEAIVEAWTERRDEVEATGAAVAEALAARPEVVGVPVRDEDAAQRRGLCARLPDGRLHERPVGGIPAVHQLHGPSAVEDGPVGGRALHEQDAGGDLGRRSDLTHAGKRSGRS